MRTITCPRCGASISLSRNLAYGLKPFCARCGWNLDRAEKALAGKSSTVKYIPIGLAVVGIFGAMAALNGKSAIPFLIPLAFGAVLLLPLWGYLSAKKAVAAAKFTASPSLAQSQPMIDMYLQQLQVMPRPRRVRVRFPSTLVLALVFFAAIALVLVLLFAIPTAPPRGTNHANGSPRFVVAVILPLVFTVVFVLPLFRDRSKIPLFRDGELALARVTYQEDFQQGKSSYSRIGYEFKSSSGQLVQDHAKDLTFSVFEDMTIPVFYDPLDPSKNVTPCATYLQVSTNPF